MAKVKAENAGRRLASPALIIVAAVAAIAAFLLVRHMVSNRPPKTNVVLLLLDTVRSDRLGCYGGDKGLTPEIDGLAAEAVLFENAFSQSPWTLPSVATIFTGRYPIQHGAGGHLGAFRMLGEDAVTLAEIFQKAGAVTGAVTNVMFLTERFGMAQGFETVDSTEPQNNNLLRRAGPTTRAALSWLEARGERPFFLFVHYFDPHLTYDPPQPYRRRFADPRDAESGDILFGTVSDIVQFRRGALNLGRDKIKRLELLHDGEVAYLDSQVGELLEGMSSMGLDGNTVVVVTSDHGEEFGEHGGFEHGHTLYDELLRVPLIIRMPAASAAAGLSGKTGLPVPTVVRLIDIAPTLCELAGLGTESAFTGRSLVQLMAGGGGPDRPVLSEGNMWGPSGVAWRSGGFKLIRPSPSIPYRLFDLAADPGELEDVSAARSQLRSRMAGDLELILRNIRSRGDGGRPPRLTREDMDRLRSLGYLQ